jgi:clan AA aspartic protease
MITGSVTAGEARIRLRIYGPRGRQREIEAVIDTGYTGWLTLPRAEITTLRLPWQGFGRGVLADGNVSYFNVYEATVVWDRRSRRVPIDEADTVPLVGMALLRGYELKIEARQGGIVTIKRLKQQRRR